MNDCSLAGWVGLKGLTVGVAGFGGFGFLLKLLFTGGMSL